MSDSDAIDLESVADTQQHSGERSVFNWKKSVKLVLAVALLWLLADLFVDMPAFDLNLLFEDDLSVVPDVEDQT